MHNVKLIYCLLLWVPIVFSGNVLAAMNGQSNNDGELFQVLDGIDNHSYNPATVGGKLIARDPLINQHSTQNRVIWNQQMESGASLESVDESIESDQDQNEKVSASISPLRSRETQKNYPGNYNVYEMVKQEMLSRLEINTYTSMTGLYSDIKQQYNKMNAWIYDNTGGIAGDQSYRPHNRGNQNSTTGYGDQDEFLAAVDRGVSNAYAAKIAENNGDTIRQIESTSYDPEQTRSLLRYFTRENILYALILIVCLRLMFRAFKYIVTRI